MATMTAKEREQRRRLWLRIAAQAALALVVGLALWYGLLPLLRFVARGSG